MITTLLRQYSHINYALADQALVSGVNFLTGILLARVLGLESFGVFTLLWMVVLFVNSIQMAAISSPMMTIGPKQSINDEHLYYQSIIGNQLLFSIFTTILVLAVLSLASFIFKDLGLSNILFPLVLVVFFNQNQDFLRRYFFVLKRPYDALLIDLVSYGGQLAALVVLYGFYDVSIYTVLLLIAATSAASILVAVNKIDIAIPDFKRIQVVWLRNWSFSKWSILSALFQWGSSNMIFIFIGLLLGSSSVGALKACQNVLAALHIFFQGMENFVPVRASLYLYDSGFSALRNYINRVLLFGGAGVLILLSTTYFLSSHLLAALYGDDYLAYGYVLKIYSIAYLFLFTAFPLIFGLRAIENVKAVFVAQLFSSAFVFIVGWFAVEVYELQGAAVMILISYIIQNIILSLHFYRNGSSKV